MKVGLSKLALLPGVLGAFCLLAAGSHAASLSTPDPGCDIRLVFENIPPAASLLYANPGKSSRIRLLASNIGDSRCPAKKLKLLRYQGRQGWVQGAPKSLRALKPGASVELSWKIEPLAQGYYTFKPQFVGGLQDADESNHNPDKRFRSVFRAAR